MQNFMQIPPRGASRQMGEIYAKIFISIYTCQLHFSPTDPCCHANEIWDKIGYNSACVKDICEIFASIGGFSGMGH